MIHVHKLGGSFFQRVIVVPPDANSEQLISMCNAGKEVPYLSIYIYFCVTCTFSKKNAAQNVRKQGLCRAPPVRRWRPIDARSLQNTIAVCWRKADGQSWVSSILFYHIMFSQVIICWSCRWFCTTFLRGPSRSIDRC